LGLGATLRHQHAGLAVPDFPLAYGRVWPATDAAALTAYNQNRMELRGEKPITALHIYLHLTHRFMAVVILGVVTLVAWTAKQPSQTPRGWGKWTQVWLAITVAQALLGALTIWSNKAADVATGHVMLGSLTLVTGALLTVSMWRSRPVMVSDYVGVSARDRALANRLRPTETTAPAPSSSP
jgi:cytochrome c oxidase assembly protein subunit 15